jgi:hypothetical protein
VGRHARRLDAESAYQNNARAFLESAELAELHWERAREFVPAVIDG